MFESTLLISKDLILTNFTDLNQIKLEEILVWRNDERTRLWLTSSDRIESKEHLAFVSSLKNRDDICFYLVSDELLEYGVISLKNIDTVSSSAELGLYKKPDIGVPTGKRLLSCLESLAFDILNLNVLTLTVNIKNTVSVGLYEQCGYAETNGGNVWLEMKKTKRSIE